MTDQPAPQPAPRDALGPELLSALMLDVEWFDFRSGFRQRMIEQGYVVNGAVLLLTGLLLAFPPTRLPGFGLGLLECLAIYVTLVRHKAFSHMPPSVVLLIVMAVAWWGLSGFGLPR